MSDAWQIERLDWRRELSTADLEALRAASTCSRFVAGETIFSPAREPHSVYLLEDGLARIFRLSEAGAETTFGFVCPGEIFGELAAIGNYPRESFAEAVRDSSVWRIPSERFQQAISAQPDLVFAVARQIGDRFKRIESRVENLVFRGVRARLARILLELAEDFGEASPDGVRLGIELTQTELSTLVGSSRQSVNESLQELTESGLVKRRGRGLVLPDTQALERLAF